MDRTARWVQRHSNITQPYEQPMHLSSLQHRARLQREDGHSSQSSRTDLGAPDQGIGSSGRTRPKRSSTVAAVAGSIQESGFGDRALPPNTRYQHHRSHSHSLPHEHHPHQRLNIPSSLYQNQKFVHGPPGSGYPMPMVAASPPIIQNPIRTGIRGTPSPPLRIPVPLNPKVSHLLLFSPLNRITFITLYTIHRSLVQRWKGDVRHFLAQPSNLPCVQHRLFQVDREWRTGNLVVRV